LNEENLTPTFTHESLYKVIKVCASLPKVKFEVKNNHDDNQWWPLFVTDWRLRMLIAGWSTRISYKMISKFQKVVSELEKIGYDDICELSETDLRTVIASLGLFTSRQAYLLSLQEFINNFQDDGFLFDTPNDDLIEIFEKNVKGAGYKVAQCAVLYAKGYHCGTFPIDSGMKDMLGPCLGIRLPKGPYAHEVMRKELEGILNQNSIEYQNLVVELGYIDLQIPKDTAPIWWAHLVLIYFKREFCNQHDPAGCPLRENSQTAKFVGSECGR
jgi:endonuclease III